MNIIANDGNLDIEVLDETPTGENTNSSNVEIDALEIKIASLETKILEIPNLVKSGVAELYNSVMEGVNTSNKETDNIEVEKVELWF